MLSQFYRTLLCITSYFFNETPLLYHYQGIYHFMNLNLATIRIKNLRLRTYIGINDDEIANQQDVVINIVIHYDAKRATDSDQMQDALNYKTITKAIIRLVEDNRFSLLEKLTADILAIAAEHPSVNFAEAEVDKPHALRFSDSVSLTLSCTKE
ncbi:MAG: D-erythro-7,8-dihydroneopterin triphosphate epimerase [Kangiellaceae bacterium]|jgi:D-erythro-7,8-dihydroneopterin triphosphate epimerase